MLNNLQSFDGRNLDFAELTVVDKVMMCKLLDFSVSLTEAYDNFDLRKVY